MKHKIIILGCRKITIDAIDYIIGSHRDSCEISAVIACDEERDRVYHPTLVAEYCSQKGIPCLSGDGPIEKSLIANLAPDLIFSLYYRKIIKREILDIPRLGCINVHPALLPKYRGPTPSLWNILYGDEYAGASLHYVEEGVDAGDIIDQQKIAIGDMNGFELNMRLAELGAELLKHNFANILAGTNQRIKQNHDQATYCLPFAKFLRYIIWDDPQCILNQLRAFAKPFDGALTWTARGEKIIAWEAIKLPKRTSFSAPGVYEKTPEGIVVQTSTVPILLKKWEVLDGGDLNAKGRFISGPPVE